MFAPFAPNVPGEAMPENARELAAHFRNPEENWLEVVVVESDLP